MNIFSARTRKHPKTPFIHKLLFIFRKKLDIIRKNRRAIRSVPFGKGKIPAMKKESCKNPRLGTVGGQAVLEGVMMKGKNEYAIAVRRENGTIHLSRRPYVSVRSKHKILNVPFIRGIVGFVESMILNFKTISLSAEQYGIDDSEPETKFERWLVSHFGNVVMPIITGLSTVLGIVLAVGLFILLPSAVTKGIERLSGLSLGLWRNVIEGLLKIGIFICYLLLVSLMKDIRRTFEYHGAEHKSIFCYENGEELTVETVKKQKRFHPRCGTSFTFVILIISIFVNSLPFVPWDNLLLRVLVKLLMLPIIVGLGFEFIMFSGKHDNLITRILSAPGLWMQRITTREPDGSQIEVAIASLKAALPDVFPEYADVDENGKILGEPQKKTDEAAGGTGEPAETPDSPDGVLS